MQGKIFDGGAMKIDKKKHVCKVGTLTPQVEAVFNGPLLMGDHYRNNLQRNILSMLATLKNLPLLQASVVAACNGQSLPE